jgi:hypothetical protein
MIVWSGEPAGSFTVPGTEATEMTQTTEAPKATLFKKSWLPTRKWLAGVITAAGAFLVNWIQAGEFNTEIQVALVGVVVAALLAYLVPNDSNPGGYHGESVSLVETNEV